MPSITGLSLLNAGHLSVRRVSAQTSLRAMGPLAACTRLCTFISFPPIQVKNSNAAGSGPPAALTKDPVALRLQQLAGQSEQYAHRYSADLSQRHLTIKVEVEEYASAEYWTKMLALHPPPHRAVGHAQPRSQPRTHRRDALVRAGERHDLGLLHQPRRCGARARAARPPLLRRQPTNPEHRHRHGHGLPPPRLPLTSARYLPDAPLSGHRPPS